jgi:hypothetical protein
MTKKRKHRNLHKIEIEQIRDYLSTSVHAYLEPTIVELHTTSMRRMPVQLKGVPDLIISWKFNTTYVEIKPFYEKSRDKLNDDQCRFAADIYPILSKNLRYWVIADFGEFKSLWTSQSQFYMENYHQLTVADWCERRGREIPWE